MTKPKSLKRRQQRHDRQKARRLLETLPLTIERLVGHPPLLVDGVEVFAAAAREHAARSVLRARPRTSEPKGRKLAPQGRRAGKQPRFWLASAIPFMNATKETKLRVIAAHCGVTASTLLRCRDFMEVRRALMLLWRSEATGFERKRSKR